MLTPTTHLLKWMTWCLVFALLPIVVHQALWPIIVTAWALLSAAAIIDLMLLRCPAPSFQIKTSKTTGVGEEHSVLVTWNWSVQTPTHCRLKMETKAPLLPGVDVQTKIPPGESQVQLVLNSRQRGQGEILAIWVKLEGRFKLFSRILRLPLQHPPISIVPSLPKVKAIALKHFGAMQLRGGIRLEKRHGEGSEFDALETYVPGHDPRNVDWKASARHQQLCVRRYRVERNQRVIFCLDTGHLMVDPIEGSQRLDHAIHASLLLGYFALKAGDLVGLYSYNSQPQSWLPPSAGIHHFKRLNHSCSQLFTEDVETNHVLGLHRLLTKLTRRTLIVVFTEFSHSITASLLQETIQHLVRKHLVIFVALDDPIVEKPLLHQPENPSQLSKAIVASDLQSERHKVLKQLKRGGVHIVHGLPELATVQLIAQYTEIKRRELIG